MPFNSNKDKIAIQQHKRYGKCKSKVSLPLIPYGIAMYSVPHSTVLIHFSFCVIGHISRFRQSTACVKQSVSCSTPVSYTHLDVYKRQVYSYIVNQTVE